MASSDKTTNVRKHSWLKFGTIPVYGWKERVSRQPSVKIRVPLIRAEIWTWSLLNMKYELNPLDFGIGRLICFSSTIRSAITCLSLTRIGYNAIEGKVKAVGVTQTAAYMCWLLGNFSDQCGDIAPNFFHTPHYFYYEILVKKNATIAL